MSIFISKTFEGFVRELAASADATYDVASHAREVCDRYDSPLTPTERRRETLAGCPRCRPVALSYYRDPSTVMSSGTWMSECDSCGMSMGSVVEALRRGDT